MASALTSVGRIDVLPPNKPAAPFATAGPPRSFTPQSYISEEDTDTIGSRARDTDSISIDSMKSIPDFDGRKMLTFDDERTTTAYEAWEVVCVDETFTDHVWKSFCGIKFGSRRVYHKNGGVFVKPIVSFEQGELADMRENAIRAYKHGRGTNQENAYEQDLANRAFKLPVGVYDKLEALIVEKTFVTNRNPYRKRDWRVVVLRPGEFRMTNLLPERKRRHIFSRKRQLPATRTWFVVLQGQEIKSTKDDGGWKAYNRHSNPWWRLDTRETQEERRYHKDFFQKYNKPRGYPRPRPRQADAVDTTRSWY
ncbi:hypothetical protein F5Y19DRAFT_478009 [Xylariaceae sp. FL1651]|nr:hypothetical protein F5Y19DRAFT_478009 [Xylariaceae sp. FL1651]